MASLSSTRFETGHQDFRFRAVIRGRFPSSSDLLQEAGYTPGGPGGRRRGGSSRSSPMTSSGHGQSDLLPDGRGRAHCPLPTSRRRSKDPHRRPSPSHAASRACSPGCDDQPSGSWTRSKVIGAGDPSTIRRPMSRPRSSGPASPAAPTPAAPVHLVRRGLRPGLDAILRLATSGSARCRRHRNPSSSSSPTPSDSAFSSYDPAFSPQRRSQSVSTLTRCSSLSAGRPDGPLRRPRGLKLERVPVTPPSSRQAVPRPLPPAARTARRDAQPLDR